MTAPCIVAQGLSIKGRVVSTNNNPVEFANVVLQTSDSVFVAGGITDIKGRFSMENVHTGKYNLMVSCIGFSSTRIDLSDFTKSVDLGNVAIDSTSVSLDEVVVTASHVINQIDRKIVLPTAHQLKASTNGLSLLQNMKLSRIQVDPVNYKIAVSGGGTAQLRINGVKAEVQEVMGLRPEDILRIEHHDDPGLRFEGADAVIDFITRRKDSGGYIAIDTQNSPHVLFGDNNITAKLNHKKTEIGLRYYGRYRTNINMWRENTEHFNYVDGITFTRREDGLRDQFSEYGHYLNMSYNYQEPDKWMFQATLRGNFYGMPKNNFTSYLYPVNDSSDRVLMKDYTSDKRHAPALDLYYQRNLKNKQTLILNVVGTYNNSNDERTYQESKEDDLLTDIFSSVDGDKYSVIGEGIYEKMFTKGKLSVGIRHTQSITDNEYREHDGNIYARTEMEQADTYAYAEYSGKINKFSYSLGVGGTRSWFSQSDKGYTDYRFRPTVRMTYNFTDNTFLRYRGNIASSAPSLSDLSNVEQLIDSLQIRRGNPNLKPVTRYTNSLYFNHQKGLFSGNLYIFHQYQKNPIMDEIFLENDLFVRTKDNQRSWQKLNTELEVKFGPIRDILTISLTGGLNYFDSRGNNYHHTYDNWYYRVELMANYKNWTAMFQLQSHNNDFYGETLEYGENFHLFGIMYRHKQWNLGILTFNPFSDNYKRGSQNFSDAAPSQNWWYIKETSRLFVAKISWNFSFGRKYQAGSKRLNNEDNDIGVMSGGK